MSNTRQPIRQTVIALVLLATLGLVAAAPAAAAPTADSGGHAESFWSGIVSWSFTGWMTQAIDWVGSVWEHSSFSADPNGQRETMQARPGDWSLGKAQSTESGHVAAVR